MKNRPRLRAFLILQAANAAVFLLLTWSLKGWDRLGEMVSLTGFALMILAFITFMGRNGLRTKDATWQAMEVRKHMDAVQFQNKDLEDVRTHVSFATLLIIEGVILFFLPMIPYLFGAK
ncbi:hypothetical protein ABB02_01562 [Clostridiaceae bacterium JG1575]|nr:hypothetical protein ABB02_01562 [Clostridiaceae bacterium JG1575]